MSENSGVFELSHCWMGNGCIYWEATPIAYLCKHPECKNLGSGEQNEINKNVENKCENGNFYTEARDD